MLSSSLKAKLRSGTLTCGSWITLAHPAIAEIAAHAGFDWLVVDLEHSVITIEQAADLIRIIDLSKVSPLVRLTSNDPNQIKRVMDAGAHGIIVPMVNSKEQAQQAVSAVYYPPYGKRGVGLARAQGYGRQFKEYINWLEDGPVVIVQIEHKDALQNLDEIMSVEGIDGYIVGPYDLSSSMGFPGEFDNPQVISAIKQIRLAGEKAHIAAGFHVVEPDLDKVIYYISEGYKIIAYSVDIRLLETSLQKGIKYFKEFTS